MEQVQEAKSHLFSWIVSDLINEIEIILLRFPLLI